MPSTKHKEATLGGGGTLVVKKGTDCGRIAVEWWLSRHEMAKKRRADLSLYCMIGKLSESLHPML